MSFRAPPPKKDRLTLEQLSRYDDILTDALVDHVYYWTTIRKNKSAYHSSRGVREEDVTSILQKWVIVENNPGEAEKRLFELSGIKKFSANLKTEKEKKDFRDHLRRYVDIYRPDCSFEVSSTNRYTVVTNEASVTARKLIKKGEVVKYLSGIQVLMTPEEEEEIQKSRRDFSIVISSRNKQASLFLGPARFANHDCGANAELITKPNQGMAIKAVRNIEEGDEITVTYGENYFGEDNCECLCKSCEDACRNGWSKGDGDIIVAPKQSIEEASGSGGSSYSLRRRQRMASASSSRNQSETPEITIRPHVPKRTPRSASRFKNAESPLGNSPSVSAEPASTSKFKQLGSPLKNTVFDEARSGSPKPKRDDGSLIPESDSQPAKTAKNEFIIDALIDNATVDETHSTPLKRKRDDDSLVSHRDLNPVKRFKEDLADNLVKVEEQSMTITESLQNIKESEISQNEVGATPSSSLGSRQASLSPSVPSDSTATTPPSTAEESRGVSPSLCAPSDGTTPTDSTSVDDDTIIVQPRVVSPIITRLKRAAKGVKKEQATADHPVLVSNSEVEHHPGVTVQDDVSSTLSELPDGMFEDMDFDGSSLTIKQGRHGKKKQETKKRKRNIPRPVTDLDHAPKVRIPGDYVLTPLLLAEPESAWINCTICEEPFVQKDAYFTRSSCPRCERHSKLYGYMWPKTDREGDDDDEERVLDHRTVHRFIDPSEEKMARRKSRSLTESRAATREASEVIRAQSKQLNRRKKTKRTTI